jgi:subtilisin family serine protease
VFQPDVQTLKAAGIAVVFSAGNTGPSLSSSVAPANYPESFAVGSIGTFLSEFEISDISARGPSACDGSVFPEVIAPGSFVKTSDLTAGGAIPNSYAFVSGTSFAAPHVSGVMALLLGAFPDTSIASLETALRQSSVDLGVVGEDNTYGYGMIDSLASFNYLSGKTNAELRLLTPNGGESLGGGGSQTIQWGLIRRQLPIGYDSPATAAPVGRGWRHAMPRWEQAITGQFQTTSIRRIAWSM